MPDHGEAAEAAGAAASEVRPEDPVADAPAVEGGAQSAPAAQGKKGGGAVARQGRVPLPAPKPRPFAEMFASLPQTVFLCVMFHAFFMTPPKATKAGEGGGGAASAVREAAAGSPLGGGQAVTGGAGVEGGPSNVVANNNQRQGNALDNLPKFHAPLWYPSDPFEMSVYLSTSTEPFPKGSRQGGNVHPGAIDLDGNGGLIWKESGLFFDTREGQERAFERNFTAAELPMAWANESVYAHVYFTRGRARAEMHMGSSEVAYGMFNLVAHLKRPKAKRTKNLIDGKMSERDQEILRQNAILNITEDREDEIVPHWKPELQMHLVEEGSVFPQNGIPHPMFDYMKICPKTNKYWPIVHMNEFWLMRNRMPPINATLTELPLKLTFNVAGRMKWLMVIQWENSMKQQKAMGTYTDKDQDEMKRIFLESNPVLLGVTACVSILHTVFDFLAFKNDISFWRKVESMKGLSVRAIFTNIISQTVIFLYLVDNDSSWLILFSSGVGLLIEIWKVKKAMNITIVPAWPFVTMEYKSSYSSETLKYDQLAMRYLSYLLYPLSLGFSMYSLTYNQYKSWYSWLLSSAVGCVYTFGFIMMTPQLFINYKLKSVAHLPWRAMVYKFLNTIIDDLFAFVIKMPTLHRLSCFRDDIIFLIYLYQRYAYSVDRTRVNEYGLVAKEMDEALGEGDSKAAPAGAAQAAAVKGRKAE